MTEGPPDAIRTATARETSSHADADAADQNPDLNQYGEGETAARPVRYLWPALMSLWQARVR
jgi:hypothetical protein